MAILAFHGKEYTRQQLASLFRPFRAVQKHEKSPFGLSAPRGSIKILHLAFLRHAEAWKSSIWPFRATRKHKKSLFGLSAPRGSMKILHLAFLRHAEARKSSIWSFCATRKHENPSFGLSAPRGSMKKSLFNAWYVVSNSKIPFLVLDTLYLTPKFLF